MRSGPGPSERDRLLVVDDEETIRHVLVNVLEENDCETRAAGSAEEALSLLSGFVPSVALLDIVLPGKNGLDLLVDIKKMLPDTEVIMMTSHASAESALRAIKEGAYTYLRKPFEDLDEIWITVQRALEKRALTMKNRILLREQEERNLSLSSHVALPAGSPAAADSRSYGELLEFFMDMVTKELQVDSACLMLVDEPTGTLKIAASRGLAAGDHGSVSVELGNGISGSVAMSGEPFLAPGARRKRASRRAASVHPSESFFSSPIALCVAIQTDQRTLGVFSLGDRNTGRPFDESDAAHLSALGNQLAVAIEGARRADQLQRAYESLKSAQEQLIFSERIKAIGQMAAGVAHDFNNALAAILARAQIIRDDFTKGAPDPVKALAGLDTIIKTALKGAQIIRRIQDYTRIRKDAPQTPMDINFAIKDAIEISRPKWKQEAEAKGTRIEVEAALSQVPMVTGIVHELTQVVENLIFNAVEAMPGGGRITLATRRDGETVVVEVSDTGIGMDEATRKRLFEPFFTTKESGQGLGTSIVYGIIQRHRGSIVVRSQSGHGTTFTITLPSYVPRARSDRDTHAASSAPRRLARVLFVDDEVGVREAYGEALRLHGHQVVTARHGEEAVSLFEKEKFDLVITDLSMGAMSGFEVAKRVKAINPHVPVVLLTGWAIGQGDNRVREAGVDAVLIKPCPLEDLSSAVQEALRLPVRT
jgi:signal transduction histidine kinase/DNA-binding response OmpR family regulator